MVVLCNSSMSCATPPSSTEIKMIEEFKKQWFTLMQKAYTPKHQSPFIFSPSDRSARTLEPDDARVRERAVVSQMVHRLILLDPSFLEYVWIV